MNIAESSAFLAARIEREKHTRIPEEQRAANLAAVMLSHAVRAREAAHGRAFRSGDVLLLIVPEQRAAGHPAAGALHARPYASLLRTGPSGAAGWVREVIDAEGVPVEGLGLGVVSTGDAAPWVIQGTTAAVAEAGLARWVAPWVLHGEKLHDLAYGTVTPAHELARTSLGQLAERSRA